MSKSIQRFIRLRRKFRTFEGVKVRLSCAVSEVSRADSAFEKAANELSLQTASGWASESEVLSGIAEGLERKLNLRLQALGFNDRGGVYHACIERGVSEKWLFGHLSY